MQIALVITDGEQTTTGGFTPLDEASKDMKDKGVVVYSLGVGSGVNSVQLRQIASSDDNVLTSTGFKKLTDLVYPIVEKSCLIKLTPTPTPSKKWDPVRFCFVYLRNGYTVGLQPRFNVTMLFDERIQTFLADIYMKTELSIE